jgi:hypothetical protein
VWVHPRCAFWTTTTAIGPCIVPTRQYVNTARSLPPSSLFNKCYLCGSNHGCVVECMRRGCGNRFHVKCGWTSGCSFQVKYGDVTVAVGGCLDPTLKANRQSELTIDELFRGPRRDVKLRKLLFCHEHVHCEVASKSTSTKTVRRKEDDDVLSDYSPKKSQRKNCRAVELPLPDFAEAVPAPPVWVPEPLAEDQPPDCCVCKRTWAESAAETGGSAVVCDSCDRWMHFTCDGLARDYVLKEDEPYFCKFFCGSRDKRILD